MENLKFLKDIFYNLSGREYFQYTFTGKTENENKVTLGLLCFLCFGISFFILLFFTFSIKIALFISFIILGLLVYFIYNKLVQMSNLKEHLVIRQKLFELIEGNVFYRQGDVFGEEQLDIQQEHIIDFLKMDLK